MKAGECMAYCIIVRVLDRGHEFELPALIRQVCLRMCGGTLVAQSACPKTKRRFSAATAVSGDDSSVVL